MKVCVLIRVYDRLEDLLCNLRIIRDSWTMNTYEIIVVSNGESNGHILPTEVYGLSDKVVKLKNNSGHLKGNSQLLLEGLKEIKLSDYDFFIILESDTWLYTDKIINKYSELLEGSDSVWASARWYDRFYSLATDFAIIKTSFLIDNVDIFDFERYPECHVYNYLFENKYSCIYIEENMYTHLPGYIKRFPYAPHGRFYVFPESMMVTHHVEDFKEGMAKKKRTFNAVAKYMYFKDVDNRFLWYRKAQISLSHFCGRLFPRRTWYSTGSFFDFHGGEK